MVDSREKQRAIIKIIAEFDKQNVKHLTNKLPVGDYMSLDNPKIIVDRKQNLNELCNNVGQQHERFVNEIKLANELGIKLVFLCEHGGNIKSLEDVFYWKNPRIKVSPYAMNGHRLFKILHTLQQKYGVEFRFCTKAQTGKQIIEILSTEKQISIGDMDNGISV